MDNIIKFPSKKPELAVVKTIDPTPLESFDVQQRKVQLKRMQDSLRRIHQLLEQITHALSQHH